MWLYVDWKRNVTTNIPEFETTLSPEGVASHETIDHLASIAEGLHHAVEMEAWTQVESFAEEAREEREREGDIKRRHTERYFEERIGEWEERLETYRQQAEEGEDMSVSIGNAESKLGKLRRERDRELDRLEEDRHVTPEEPELITAAFVVSAG